MYYFSSYPSIISIGISIFFVSHALLCGPLDLHSSAATPSKNGKVVPLHWWLHRPWRGYARATARGLGPVGKSGEATRNRLAGWNPGGKRRNLVNPLKMDGWLEIGLSIFFEGWLEVGLSMFFHLFAKKCSLFRGPPFISFFLEGKWVNKRFSQVGTNPECPGSLALMNVAMSMCGWSKGWWRIERLKNRKIHWEGYGLTVFHLGCSPSQDASHHLRIFTRLKINM